MCYKSNAYEKIIPVVVLFSSFNGLLRNKGLIFELSLGLYVPFWKIF